jgi:hypothetical protein
MLATQFILSLSYALWCCFDIRKKSYKQKTKNLEHVPSSKLSTLLCEFDLLVFSQEPVHM